MHIRGRQSTSHTEDPTFHYIHQLESFVNKKQSLSKSKNSPPFTENKYLLVTILSQVNSVHALITSFFNIHFNIIWQLSTLQRFQIKRHVNCSSPLIVLHFSCILSSLIWSIQCNIKLSANFETPSSTIFSIRQFLPPLCVRSSAQFVLLP